MSAPKKNLLAQGKPPLLALLEPVRSGSICRQGRIYSLSLRLDTSVPMLSMGVFAETNQQLCQPKGALLNLSNDGYQQPSQQCKFFHKLETTLTAATALSGRCHSLAPFWNFKSCKREAPDLTNESHFI